MNWPRYFSKDINETTNNYHYYSDEQAQAKIKELEKENEELKDFAIWMTGCGYDFCQHDYFNKQRDKLLKGNEKPKEQTIIVELDGKDVSNPIANMGGIIKNKGNVII